VSLADGRPCVCGGSNSNCARCFGTGVIESVSISSPRTARHMSRAVKPKPQVAPEPRVQCPRCTVRLPASEMRMHVYLRHVMGRPVRGERKTGEFRTARSVASVRPDERRDLIGCPVCMARVKTTRMERHLRDVHKRKSAGIPSIRAELPTAPSRGTRTHLLVKCADCGAMVKRTKLASHTRKVHNQAVDGKHGVPAPAQTIYAQPLAESGVSGAEAGLENLGQPDQRAIERQLDASRDYYRYRENGRFGSHSVHDDFGDESSS